LFENELLLQWELDVSKSPELPNALQDHGAPLGNKLKSGYVRPRKARKQHRVMTVFKVFLPP
jgi:hypothetical protein